MRKNQDKTMLLPALAFLAGIKALEKQFTLCNPRRFVGPAHFFEF
tara:strand:- start:623 stop:757 length:135 start_codon:yes stop_codon:yes gene_type:complete